MESLLCLIKCFLKNRKQRIVIIGQKSSWTNVLAGDPQGSILDPLFFLIYINDLSDDLSSNPKLFADDTSLFSVVNDKNTSVKELSNDLGKISNWAYQWKMSSNLNPLKEAQEVFFSHKMTKTNHPTLIFNDNAVFTRLHYKNFLEYFLIANKILKNILKL